MRSAGPGRRMLGGLALLVLAACSSSGPKRCVVTVAGTLPVISRQGSPVVRAGINGHPVALTVDTGAVMSLIGESHIEPLGLSVLGSAGRMQGVGGDTFADAVRVNVLDMGGSRATDVVLPAGGNFPARFGDLPLVGLFGDEFLSNYDTVIDLPDHVVTLLRQEGCPTPAPLWSGKIHTVRLERAYSASGQIPKPVLTVGVGGKEITALLDSGASGTMMTRSAARRAGVTRAMLERDPSEITFGITRDPTRTYRHVFAQVTVGDLTFRNVPIRVIDDLPDEDMLLGSDFLRHYRVWISREGTLSIQHGADIPADDPDRVAAR